MTLAVTAAPRPVIDRPWLLIATAGLALGAAAIAVQVDARQAALFLLGGVLGLALYHAAFGFTGGWRAFVVERRGAGIRAQLLAIGLALLAFAPILAAGTVFGQPVVGAVAPVGVSVILGAFLFGLGMQLGGGCGSGTLFTVGAGHGRMLITLGFFIVGAVVGTAHLPFWLTLPSLGPVALAGLFGTWGAVAVQGAVLAALAWGTWVWERRHGHGHGPVPAAPRPQVTGPPGQRLLRGPWPLVWGAVALAAGNLATLLIAGHPWSITFAFGLWGAKIAQGIGIDIAAWPFWAAGYPARALAASVLSDVTSVMNFGLILGALAAAGLAGRVAPAAPLPWRSVAAAVLGGLLMGYGARLAFGCNIGALFSGIASGSLHGWLWLLAAFAGSYLGIRLRPAFGLANL